MHEEWSVDDARLTRPVQRIGSIAGSGLSDGEESCVQNRQLSS